MVPTSVPDPDLNPDLLVKGMDLDPDPNPNQQAKIVRKTLIPPVLWLLLDFLTLKNYVKKIAGSGSEFGSISQRHRSADPDPDPRKNVMDPENWYLQYKQDVKR
jgi:hypothetical protein